MTVVLSLEGPDGTPGLWGSPAVRRRQDPDAAWDTEVQGVILIVADTLRPDHLSFYDHDRPTAPHLSELAAGGTLFSDAHSHAPWTPVSMPALVTSLHPLSHNVRKTGERLPSSAFTLAEAYRAAGWTTAGFSAVPHTGRSADMHQGYESLVEAKPTDKYFAKTARDFVDRLLPLLERHRDERFFVFLHVFDPHAPYEPRPPFHSLWTDPARHTEHRQDLARVRAAIADPLKAMQAQATPAELEDWRRDAEARRLMSDADLGESLSRDELERLRSLGYIQLNPSRLGQSSRYAARGGGCAPVAGVVPVVWRTGEGGG